MAIEERNLPGGQWEIKATGQDIAKLKGALVPTGNEAYKDAFEKNHDIGWEKLRDPGGGIEHVRRDRVDEALQNGYGADCSVPRMVVPALPWEQRRVGPGKHRFRYNKLTKQMEEV